MLATARERAAAALLYRGATGRLISRRRLVGALHWHERASAAVNGRCPVVLVHGLGVSSRYFTPLAVRLAPRFPVVAPDLPGFGRSDSPSRPLTLPELAAALVDWLDAAAIARTSFIANSFGCQVVLELAARRPDRVESLVLIGPSVDAGARSALRQLGRLALDATREPAALVALAAFDYLVAGPRLCVATFAESLRDRPEDRLAAVQQPALVVRGERDALVSQAWAATVAARLPNGRLAVVPAAPHAAHYARAGAVARLVADFLARPEEPLGARHLREP